MVAILAMTLLTTTLHAGLIVTPIVQGEIVDADNLGSRYNGFRVGDTPGITWYRYVDEYAVDSVEIGDIDFRISVPDSYAQDFNLTGGVGGLYIENGSNNDITGDWNGSGSQETPYSQNGYDFVELLRTFDGGPLSSGSKLSQSNPFEVEYLSTIAPGNWESVTNGFQVADGGEVGGEWNNYVIDNKEVAVDGPPSPTGLSGPSLAGVVFSVTITNLTPGASNVVERSLGGPTGTWEAVHAFTSTGTSTNWSEATSNDWRRAFYRVGSE